MLSRAVIKPQVFHPGFTIAHQVDVFARDTHYDAANRMTTTAHAYARAGLVGNPSDGYFGKTISIIVRNFKATVSCRESTILTIVPFKRDRIEFDGVESLMSDIEEHGYYGGVRLIKATIKRFGDYCRENAIDLGGRNFTMRYETDIPMRVGLSGSSAIVIAAFRTLMQFYEMEIPVAVLPSLALSVEVDELGIAAGLQDRVIQTCQGAIFMDFDREHLEEEGFGQYERLDPAQLPPLFVAYNEGCAEGTEVTHNDLRSRFNRADTDVIEGMRRFAELAQQARDLIVKGRGDEIGPLMDANFDLRAGLCNISEGNHRLVDAGRGCGAAVKFAGSGGAVVGAYDGDPDRIQRIREAYASIGSKVFVPQIC